jgi:hypothetical protein
MGFQDRAYETQLAKSAWLSELAEHWRERDPECAEHLRTKARQLQSAEDIRRPAQAEDLYATWSRAVLQIVRLDPLPICYLNKILKAK